ncbi:hypothetical protein ABVF61_22265 [Roseibium sp. HPY-6]|uniref:hypothetical protein n=1 Tax=Roseibium sp. HPY-6 TaxID=3229852 RepID=UPI00338E0A6E
MTYQNFILTVIAVGLIVIAVQGLGPKGATAQSTMCGESSNNPCWVTGSVKIDQGKYSDPIFIATKRGDGVAVYNGKDVGSPFWVKIEN